MTTQTYLPVTAAPASEIRQAVVYVLHSGRLFGTERMAIATLRSLGRDFDCLLLAPPGEAADEARSLGIAALTFAGPAQMARQMAAFLSGRREATLLATGVVHSLAGVVLAGLMGVRLRHLHVVHGGTDERLSYGRKKWLRWSGTQFIAVSGFVRERLAAHGVPQGMIQVIENFLPGVPRPRRSRFTRSVERAIVVSRLDPIKRVGLLVEAVAANPALRDMDIQVFGSGWEDESLRAQAAAAGARVTFNGFVADVPAALASSDLFIHTCPEEPFGLAVLEAMAAGIPVLVPNRGGPAGFIRNGENGFTYRAGDSADLELTLARILDLRPEILNRIVENADATLRSRFTEERGLQAYRSAITGVFS